MRYFRDPDGQVYAYDEQDETQHPYMLEAVKAGWADISETWTPPQPVITAEIVAAQRLRAYNLEADPLFFKAQRGEATQQEWLAKVAEIKARYPMPT